MYKEALASPTDDVATRLVDPHELNTTGIIISMKRYIFLTILFRFRKNNKNGHRRQN